MNCRLVVLCAAGLLGCPDAPLTSDAGGDAGRDGGSTSDGGYTCTLESIDADAGAKVVPYLSLALDSSGAPYVAFHDFATDSLELATRGAAGWTHQLVDGLGDGGRFVSLGLTPGGKAHLSYRNIAAALIYATNTSGSWVVETVAAEGEASSLALDAMGEPRIIYARNVAPRTLKLATRTAMTWNSIDVDAVGELGQPSFVIDSAGKGHVSYFEQSVGRLKYATDVSGAWVTQVVDTPMVGSNNSLAIDSAGKAHVTYFDSANNKLKYATNASGTWVAITLDAAGAVAIGDTSLAIDSATGNLHVTYYRGPGTVRDLGYLTNRSGKWVGIPLAVGANDLGYASSVAVDPVRDVLHAAFSDRTTGAIRYVTCR